MKILLDMNPPPKLAGLISDKGVEAKHWYHLGAPVATEMIF